MPGGKPGSAGLTVSTKVKVLPPVVIMTGSVKTVLLFMTYTKPENWLEFREERKQT